MPVAGLTLTLHSNPALAAAAVEQLRSRAEIEVGEESERWLAIVTEVADPRAGLDLHRWIESLPGIAYVDVIYVGFDEEDDGDENNSQQQHPTTAAVSAPATLSHA